MVNLGEIPGILVDPRYAGSDNIMGRPFAGYIVPKVMGSGLLYEALRRLQDRLRPQGYQLLLYDAYRPQKAVDDLVQWCSRPEDGRTKAAYYPNIPRAELIPAGYIAPVSSHSRGSAVDLTLVYQGVVLDMATSFDFMDERSRHGVPEIAAWQTDNRSRLRDWMIEAGFEPYEREWWHYRLMHEQYPEEVFDEDIV